MNIGSPEVSARGCLLEWFRGGGSSVEMLRSKTPEIPGERSFLARIAASDSRHFAPAAFASDVYRVAVHSLLSVSPLNSLSSLATESTLFGDSHSHGSLNPVGNWPLFICSHLLSLEPSG